MKIRENFLQLFPPSIGSEELEEMSDTLKSGWLTMGPKTVRFEEALQDYIGCKNVISTNSCTSSLHLSLIAHKIGEGDEVITTPYTWVATGNVICHTGAKPVFVDVREDNLNIDPERIKDAITPRTKAIIPVHFAGHPVEMEKLERIASEHRLKIIEDAAHAIGAEYYGRKIGTSGNLTCFSFYANKNMTTGEGGAIAVEDDGLAERLRVLRLQGITKDAWKRYDLAGKWGYAIEELGYKYNLTDMQASLGLHQLKKLDGFNKRREEIVKKYEESLRGEELDFLSTHENVKHARHLFPIFLRNNNRDSFIEEMKKRNIGTGVHYIPLHLHPFYRNEFGYKEGDFPVAEKAFEREVSIPLSPDMTDKDVEYVTESIKEILN